MTMAEKLENFSFDNHRSTYAQFMDGNTWKLKAGEDFKSVASARSALYQSAQRRGLKLHSSIVDDGQAIIVQAYKPGPDA